MDIFRQSRQFPGKAPDLFVVPESPRLVRSVSQALSHTAPFQEIQAREDALFEVCRVLLYRYGVFRTNCPPDTVPPRPHDHDRKGRETPGDH